MTRRMSQAERDALHLRALELLDQGWSQAEVAERLDMPLFAVALLVLAANQDEAQA